MDQKTPLRIRAANRRLADALLAMPVTTRVSSDPNYLHSTERQSAFFFALTLQSIVRARQPLLLPLVASMTIQLRQEMSEHGSWNYWMRSSVEYVSTPYPDDLDTTFCSLLALSLASPILLTGDLLGKCVTLLMHNEEAPGGPYRTWLVKDDGNDAWKDVDPVVNANIGTFLLSQDIHLPGLDAYLEGVLRNDVLSPYYPSRLHVLYFVARAYRGEELPRLRSELEGMSANALTPFEKVLLLNALLEVGVRGADLEGLVLDVLDATERGLLERPQPLCIDSMVKGITSFAGSAALTAALTLEALSRIYIQLDVPEEAEVTVPVAIDAQEEKIFENIKADALQRFAGTEPVLLGTARVIIENTLHGDKGRQKSMLPYFFARAWGGVVDESTLRRAGLAHLFGWIAYTIYDHILDGEHGVEALPVANIALREMSLLFHELTPSASFRSLARDVLDVVEGANAWELGRTRLAKGTDGAFLWPSELPEYGAGEKLVERSWGLVLAPVAILFELGHDRGCHEVASVEKYFKHFILAKQLNDDAHDWEDDLMRGHVTSIGAEILQRYGERHGIHARDAFVPSAALEELRRICWYEVMPGVCETITASVGAARAAIASCPVADPTFFSQLLQPFEQGAQKTLVERERMISFLETLKL